MRRSLKNNFVLRERQVSQYTIVPRAGLLGLLQVCLTSGVCEFRYVNIIPPITLSLGHFDLVKQQECQGPSSDSTTCPFRVERARQTPAPCKTYSFSLTQGSTTNLTRLAKSISPRPQFSFTKIVRELDLPNSRLCKHYVGPVHITTSPLIGLY